ncbi:helix-turn-helix domain-containing protein [Alienimonas californiensis]|uniref:Helix-turn-helix domain-containing protein n=1 Tax=Alienimonas californiensis TaxID=2527989 RepID=A0A517PAX5_9PLAN|nr:helix-turn-helix domain-containing protein [Alienimonas californiensis]QDT16535.1 hypothetical protein CA12_26410 [Alienimonas californiensis]
MPVQREIDFDALAEELPEAWIDHAWEGDPHVSPPQALFRGPEVRDAAGYDRIPLAVVREYGACALTMGVLRRHLNVADNQAFPSVQRIAALTGYSERTVQRQLEKLQGRGDGEPGEGLIYHRGWQGAKVYRFTERALAAYAIGPRPSGQGRDGFAVLPRWVSRFDWSPKTRLLYAYLVSRVCALLAQWRQCVNGELDDEHSDHRWLRLAPALDPAEIEDRLEFAPQTIIAGIRQLHWDRLILVLPRSDEDEWYGEYQFLLGPAPDLNNLPSEPEVRPRRRARRRRNFLEGLLDQPVPRPPDHKPR